MTATLSAIELKTARVGESVSNKKTAAKEDGAPTGRPNLLSRRRTPTAMDIKRTAAETSADKAAVPSDLTASRVSPAVKGWSCTDILVTLPSSPIAMSMFPIESELSKNRSDVTIVWTTGSAVTVASQPSLAHHKSALGMSKGGVRPYQCNKRDARVSRR